MQVVLSKNASKHYKRLPPAEMNKIKRKLLLLENDPLVGKKLEGELSVYRSLRAWPYRIIYIINQKEQCIEVDDILHRQGAYK